MEYFSRHVGPLYSSSLHGNCRARFESKPPLCPKPSRPWGMCWDRLRRGREARLWLWWQQQIYNHLMADQRFATPVLADEREQPMFDLIPLAGSRRQMANRDLHPGLVGQLLQFQFPQTHSGPVTSAGISRDQQSHRLGVGLMPHRFPPLGRRADGAPQWIPDLAGSTRSAPLHLDKWHAHQTTTRYRGVLFVEMADIDSMARCSGHMSISPGPRVSRSTVTVGFIQQGGTTHVVPLRGTRNGQTFSSRTGRTSGFP
jgi:hypothetical protein